MLPRLEAEERLDAISTGAVAAGSVKKGDAERLMRDLRRVAKGDDKPKARTVDDLVAMGIPVTFTPKKERADG
jgi:hypothetical protein